MSDTGKNRKRTAREYKVMVDHRAFRPQKRTLAKLEDALGVSVEVLWPNAKGR
jgi:hypothetical protein